MSSTARWIIALFSLICTFSFAAIALSTPPDGTNIGGLWIMSAFCLLIAIACFPGPGRAIAVRLIGAAVFAVCVCYIVSQVGKPLPHLSTYRRSDTNIINAVIAFFIFGLPGGYVAVTGRLPGWTILGDKLHQDSDDPDLR